MFRLKVLLCCLLLIGLSSQLFAQQSVEPTEISVLATDGLTLYGDFYLLDTGAPTVFLLHELYTNRNSWALLTPLLVNAGFNVLAVDLRGYGETGGKINWPQAVTDVQTWADWLRNSAGVTGPISMIGSSMGANLALVGCGKDSLCKTAVAISPGWRYFGISVKDAFTTDLGQRPVMVVFSERDRWPSIGVPQMIEAATGPIEVVVYSGNIHGMGIFATQGDILTSAIVAWLDENGR